MIRKINKKGAIFQDKLLNTIIVIFIVALVILFLVFKVDIKKWFGAVPDFDNGNNLGNETISIESITCKEKIAEIRKPEGEGSVSKGQQYIYIDDIKTNLFWNDKKQKIMLYQKGISWNVQVGEIAKRKITIFTEYLDENSKEYKEHKSELPPMDVLNSLNNLYLFSGNDLCKADIKVEVTNV